MAHCREKTVNPRLSVALCSLDGARFLPQQLDSLLTQTRVPDELVVCDDGSTDGTVEILEEFARLTPFPVRIVRNPQRLGVAKNFELAISLCTGDVIALADQDDVWHSAKLERLARALSGADLAFSDAEVVGEALKPLGYTMWQRVGFDEDEQARMSAGDALGVLLKHGVVTGAAMAFRAGLRPLLLPIPSNWPHDAWIAAVAASAGKLVPVKETLVQYRQHQANVVGGMKKSLLRQIIEALEVDRANYYREEILRWQALCDRLAGTPAGSRLEAKLAHLKRRAGLPANRLFRFPAVAAEMARGDYARYARNWGSIALDLLVR